jgi:D-serine deaminase-like pyridoxal phosphate-dependent protein
MDATSATRASTKSTILFAQNMQGGRVADLPTPALLLDKTVLERNARTMLDRVAALGIAALRPNVKTHKSAELAELQHTGHLVLEGAGGGGGEGASKRRAMRVVTSTLAETRYFLEAGFGDVLYAVPLAGAPKVAVARELLRRYGERVSVMIDSEGGVAGVQGADVWSVFVKVDCGYGRAGRSGEALQRVVRAAEEAPWLRMRGFYTHAGHSYHIGDTPDDSLEQRAADEARAMLRLGGGKTEVSIGATPTASRPASKEE